MHGSGYRGRARRGRSTEGLTSSKWARLGNGRRLQKLNYQTSLVGSDDCGTPWGILINHSRGATSPHTPRAAATWSGQRPENVYESLIVDFHAGDHAILTFRSVVNANRSADFDARTHIGIRQSLSALGDVSYFLPVAIFYGAGSFLHDEGRTWRVLADGTSTGGRFGRRGGGLFRSESQGRDDSECQWQEDFLHSKETSGWRLQAVG